MAHIFTLLGHKVKYNSVHAFYLKITVQDSTFKYELSYTGMPGGHDIICFYNISNNNVKIFNNVYFVLVDSDKAGVCLKLGVRVILASYSTNTESIRSSWFAWIGSRRKRRSYTTDKQSIHNQPDRKSLERSMINKHLLIIWCGADDAWWCSTKDLNARKSHYLYCYTCCVQFKTIPKMFGLWYGVLTSPPWLSL